MGRPWGRGLEQVLLGVNGDRQKFLLVTDVGKVRPAKARLSVGFRFYSTVDYHRALVV
ncbi:hypothetical protein [Synechocystis salina]|uniref:Uncharacterized protein n=1 Tax=Synechocystis salina LEGE 00031 TaxID=1828736 RepID=A0ABR9VR82_9SYNC|nr:hypothetical protein [Synechocystis salina]MBE9242847.1 hypothetical protein [Synechocystis salina LEGE 00041]MBE9253830.1 hypothetical protein [Synechocystis salina LEGE 00031]